MPTPEKTKQNVDIKFFESRLLELSTVISVPVMCISPNVKKQGLHLSHLLGGVVDCQWVKINAGTVVSDSAT